MVSENEEGRLALPRGDKALGYQVEGRVAVVDVGGGSTEIIIGTADGGVEQVRSWPIGSGQLAEELISLGPALGFRDPPGGTGSTKSSPRSRSPSPSRLLRLAVRPRSLRKIVGAGSGIDSWNAASGSSAVTKRFVGRQFELDPIRVRMLATGVLISRRSPNCSAGPADRLGRDPQGSCSTC